jgi:hypothetical protein
MEAEERGERGKVWKRGRERGAMQKNRSSSDRTSKNSQNKKEYSRRKERKMGDSESKTRTDGTCAGTCAKQEEGRQNEGVEKKRRGREKTLRTEQSVGEKKTVQ